MKLEQQVCSLELAKRLKELGAKQESIIRWRQFKGWGEHPEEWQLRHYSDFSEHDSDSEEDCAAFTVAELGEMLPTGVPNEGVLNIWKDFEGLWRVHYCDEPREFRAPKNTEANARARMIIYLLENKLLKLQEVT
jgi:hypothetical protein